MGDSNLEPRADPNVACLTVLVEVANIQYSNQKSTVAIQQLLYGFEGRQKEMDEAVVHQLQELQKAWADIVCDMCYVMFMLDKHSGIDWMIF